MEVAYPPGLPAGSDLDHQAAAMADEMDIDIDVNLDPFDDGPVLQSVSRRTEFLSMINSHSDCDHRIMTSPLFLPR